MTTVSTVSSTVPSPAPTAESAVPAVAVVPEPAPATPSLEAPAPAPAAPVVPEAPAANGYEPSGNPALDLAATWVQSLGIAADDPMIEQAMQSGDFSMLKAKLASMGDKARGWEQYIALAEKGLGEIKTANEARATETLNIAHEVAGSKEAWDGIVEWAVANAEPAEKDQINAMFDAGGMQARAAALLLTQLHGAASGTVKQPDPATKGAPASAVASSGALSPDGYRQAINELVARVGAHRLDDHPEYAALKQRRAAFRG